MQETIRRLIQSQDLCVLATSRNNTPHTSLMAYVPSEDCSTFFMATYRNTNKFANLQANPKVSLLVDDRNKHCATNRLEIQALTVHGQAEIVRGDVQRNSIYTLLHQKLPRLREFLAGEQVEFVAVKAANFLLLQGPVASIYQEV